MIQQDHIVTFAPVYCIYMINLVVVNIFLILYIFNIKCYVDKYVFSTNLFAQLDDTCRKINACNIVPEFSYSGRFS